MIMAIPANRNLTRATIALVWVTPLLIVTLLSLASTRLFYLFGVYHGLMFLGATALTSLAIPVIRHKAWLVILHFALFLGGLLAAEYLLHGISAVGGAWSADRFFQSIRYVTDLEYIAGFIYIYTMFSMWGILIGAMGTLVVAELDSVSQILQFLTWLGGFCCLTLVLPLLTPIEVDTLTGRFVSHKASIYLAVAIAQTAILGGLARRAAQGRNKVLGLDVRVVTVTALAVALAAGLLASIVSAM